jgi:hypothetical protein
MAAKLPYHKRVQDAVDKIGTVNGTKIPDAQLPSDIDKKNNAEVDAWFEKHKLVREYLALDIVKKHVEARHKATKARILDRLNIREDLLGAGDTKTYQFDNVNLSYKVTNGRATLTREHLLVTLITQLSKLVPGARNLSVEEATKVIEAATTTGKPPLTLIPATTAE